MDFRLSPVLLLEVSADPSPFDEPLAMFESPLSMDEATSSTAWEGLLLEAIWSVCESEGSGTVPEKDPMGPGSSIALAYLSTPRLSFRKACAGDPGGVAMGVSKGVPDGVNGFTGSFESVKGLLAGKAKPEERPVFPWMFEETIGGKAREGFATRWAAGCGEADACSGTPSMEGEAVSLLELLESVSRSSST
jgi:hypothetical protein